MGFLSGVLGAVKDENEVTTYDNYITPDDNKLQKVLEEVNNNIGSGRTGLAASVGAVKGWLEGYGDKVNEQITKFNEPLEIIKFDINKLEKNFENQKTKSLQDQQKDWTNCVRLYHEQTKLADKARKTLDKELSKKLETPVKVVEEETKMLYGSAKNNDVMKQAMAVDWELLNQKEKLDEAIGREAEKIKETLRKQKESIENEIVMQSQKLKNAFHMQFRKIFHAVSEMKREKSKQFRNIDERVKNAQKLVEEFQMKYKEHITFYFDNIKSKLNEVYGTLCAHKLLLVDLVTQAKASFDKIKNGVCNKEHGGGESSIETHWPQLKTEMRKFVRELILIEKHEEEEDEKLLPNDGSLHVIESGTINYATKFEEKFKAAMKNMVDGMLKGGEAEGKIRGYAIVSGVPGSGDKISAVKKAIINQILKLDDSVDKPGRVPATAEKTLQSIAKYLEEYAAQVGMKMTNIVRFIDLVEKDHAMAKLTPKVTFRSSDTNLHTAFQNILSMVKKAMEDTKDEVTRFIEGSSIGKLNQAITSVEKFRSYMISTLRDIDFALSGVTGAIGELSPILEKTKQKGLIETKIDDIQTHVVEKLNEFQKDKDDKGDGEINKIKNQAEILMEKLKGEIKQKLESIEHAAKNAGGVLNDTTAALDAAYDKAYKAAGEAVDALKSNLTEAVQNSFAESQQKVQDVKKVLLTDVRKAFESVTEQVRTLFADSHKADLKALMDLLDRQKSAIEDIINLDRITGLKGLLNKMKDHFVKRINDHMSPPPAQQVVPAKSPEKTMAQVAEVVDRAFGFLFYNLERQSDFTSDFEKLRPSTTALHTLLEKLVGSKHFDYKFKENLEKLNDLLNRLIPHTFGEGQAPSILEALRRGLPEMVKELDKAYVSRYSGQRITWTETKEDQTEVPSDRAMMCAKALLSTIPTLFELMEMNEMCMSETWSKNALFKTTNNNPVAALLKRQGYEIPSSDNEENGELRCGLTSKGICTLLVKENKLCNYMGKKEGRIYELCEYLNLYHEVCHLSKFTAKRHPCSAYEMLCWLSGLPHNPMYAPLRFDALPPLMQSDKPTKDKDDDIDIDFVDHKSLYLAAYPHDVRYNALCDAIDHVCTKAYDVLCTVLGTGDAHTKYACYYSNNSLGLTYPANAEECLQMFVDVLSSLLAVFRYIEKRCSLSTQHNGWSNCLYGRDIMSSKFQCKNHLNNTTECQPTDKPTTQAKCQPNGEPKCQPTSPLQSYLNDCLTGHLPHHVTSIGCKAKCTTCPSNKPGQPCLTPLGFRGFSGSPKTGKELCRAIRRFLDHDSISALVCILPKPPSTLPQHFGFVLSLVRGWANSGKLENKRHNQSSFQSTFESSVDDKSIYLYPRSSDLTRAFTNAYGSQSVVHDSCRHPHLVNFTSSSICSNADKKVDCAPFLASLFDDAYYYMALKQVDAYLSWAVYLPWTFWRYLATLYDEFCNISCNDWGCSKCMHGDKCKPGQHGLVDDKTQKPHCQCPSIVGCTGVSSTLHKFGFTFDDAKFLNRLTSAKTCTDFCKQLRSVLHSEYFEKLFEKCDEFLWKIREPFSYLVLSLWLLSLFYLLHIMVIRLDLLHIKSHLHSPSSHRIAAQSLLAAARVGKLAKISYLQP
ncbi:hypothetical protein, conserved [Babesia bigemina]|uniref:C3H1-type domain-containing protein n=1 Tax=Babesia bigemina TaxID=5866 RepID=A0A061BKE8_BABBI|nr:hypothetical protein, conserved [Babesia bigemina]CDR71398.1 hypothetical protein, conserved [Babesia bigemina]|eukprot:XP_012770348.1 hypothetical protein, conserved [Babesia bigemina]